MNPVVHVNSDAFRLNPAAVYIGRPMPFKADQRLTKGGYFQNPFKVGKHRVAERSVEDCLKIKAMYSYVLVNRGGHAVECYREWMARRLKHPTSGPVIREELAAIIAAGRAAGSPVPLGCWCKVLGHEPCHGDVVAEMVAEHAKRSQ